MCIYHLLFIYLSIHRPLGCFHLLANTYIMNSVAMNMDLQICLPDPAFQFLWILEVGLLGYMVIIFLIFREASYVFHRGCILLQSYQQCRRVPIFPLAKTCYFLIFFILAIFMGTEVESHCGFDLYFFDN